MARRPRLPTLHHHRAAEGRGTHSEQGRQLSTELTPRSLGQVFTSVSLSFLIGNLGVRNGSHSKCKLCYRCSKTGTPTSFVRQPPKQLNTQPKRPIHTRFPPCANHRAQTEGGESQRKVCKTVWPGARCTVRSHCAFTFTIFGAGPRVPGQQRQSQDLF